MQLTFWELVGALTLAGVLVGVILFVLHGLLELYLYNHRFD